MVYDKTLSAAVLKFEDTGIKFSAIELNDPKESFQKGIELAKSLKQEQLKSIFILSDGLNVNGSQLTKGLNDILKDVVITGGLAGDGADFKQTWVLVDNEPRANYITAAGLYGDKIHTAYGSQGGWHKFGIDRMVTEAKENTLYKLDHKTCPGGI